MNRDLRQYKTIDLHSAKKQLSSKNSNGQYFNPYTRQAAYLAPERVYTPEASPEYRKKQLRENNKLSKGQIRRNKQRRKIRFMIKLFFIMLVTVSVVWGGLQIKEMITYPKVSYQIVQTGSIDNSQTFEGVIIRQEKVYYSQGEGILQAIIPEGEKAKRNGEVCVLINGTSLVQTLEEKDKVSTELYNTARSREQFSYYQDELFQIQNSIKNTMNTFYSERFKDTTEYIYNIRSELENYTDQRTKLYIKEQNLMGNSTGQKLTLLDAQINEMHYTSLTEESGIVSYGLDGAEAELTPEILADMAYDSFQQIQKKNYQNIGYNSQIAKGVPLYKIVSGDRWYIVTYVDLKAGESYKEGQVYQLNFETIERLKINFKLSSKVIEEDKIKLVFEANEQIDRFLNLRLVNFTIGNRNEEGLKIPLQAIVEQNMMKIPANYQVEKDGQVGVYRKNGEITEFVKISPQYQREDMVYILQEIGEKEALRIKDILYEPVTQATYQVDEIQTTEGVYVINGNLAQFKKVDIYLRNNEHALIKYSANNELKELDKIISNPKSIKRDQLLQHMSIQNE